MKNRFVTYREKILNRILKTDPDDVLNSPEPSPEEVPGNRSLDMEIKSSLNRIKAEAVSENGKQVNYSKLAQSPSYQEHRKLVNLLNTFEYQALPTWEGQLAFWINLYNALVIDAVIQENVLSSVTESRLGIMRFFQKAAYRVGGDRFSLTDIEHGVLRENSGFPHFPGSHFSPGDTRQKSVVKPMDFRIHFALNCASNSCPPIGVYNPDSLDKQLDLATRNFINVDSILDLKKKQFSISKIFRWYWADFGGKDGILRTLGNYLDRPEIQGQLGQGLSAFRLKFHPYDWGLNKIS